MKVKIIFFTVTGIFALIVIGFVFKLRAVANQSIVPSNQSKPKQYTSLADKIKHKQAFSILLLGYAGGKHDGTYLTDSIIIANVNPSLKKVNLISIPRDMWVTIPLTDEENRNWKINAAYQLGSDDKGYPDKKKIYTGAGGGGKLIKDVVSSVIGQPMDRFIAIDFAGFKKTIDTLGGVDVQIEQTFDDYAYPLDNIPDESCGRSEEEIKLFTATVSAEPQLWEYFSCRYKHLHFDKGTMHMDGTTALEFVRSRHSAINGSDFGRAKRQRNLITAVKNKVLSPAFITHAIPFIESLGNDLRTDISLTEINALIQNLSILNTFDIQAFALTDKNYLNQTFSSDGQAILAPKEGINNWSKVQQWIQDIFAGNPIQTSAVVLVENGTKTPGLAQKAVGSLNDLSIQTVIPRNNLKKTDSSSMVIYDKNIRSAEINIIMKEFDIKSVVYANTIDDEFNVLVTLGDDYKTKISITPTSTK